MGRTLTGFAALLVLLLALALGACGGGQPAPVAGPAAPLGVQGNSQSPSVELRVLAEPGASYTMSSVVEFEADFMGRRIAFAIENRALRRVVESRADGAILLEDQSTSTITTQQLGTATPETTTEGPEDAPARAWMSPRGVRTLVDREAPASPVDRDRVREHVMALLEEMIHGLEYPEGTIERGHTWRSEGMTQRSEQTPGTPGGVLYRVTQRLDRVEGSGQARVAVIAVEVRIEAEGMSSPMGAMSGAVDVRGSYVVLVADGFVRTLDLSISGEATLAARQVPVRGSVRYEADALR